MDIEIKNLTLGPLETNCYILRSGDKSQCETASGDPQENCWIIDPGWGEPLISTLTEQGLIPTAILLTHGHGDHIAGVAPLKDRFPKVRVICPAGDAEMLTNPVANMSASFGIPMSGPPADELIAPGTTLRFDQTQWEVLDTSGHTPGGVSYWCESEQIVITGDALFAGSIGRSDMPGASADRLIQNIREKLLVLPDETRVAPGHGPQTTIGREKRTNPFLSK
ncbi:MAG: MBL fold metallo-hydrolase [Planctomycetota bacterium]